MTRSCTAGLSLLSALVLMMTQPGSAPAQSPSSPMRARVSADAFPSGASERQLVYARAMQHLHGDAVDQAGADAASPRLILLTASEGHPKRWITIGAIVGAVTLGVGAAMSASQSKDELSSVATGPAFVIGAVTGAVAGGLIGGLSYLVVRSSSHATATQ